MQISEAKAELVIIIIRISIHLIKISVNSCAITPINRDNFKLNFRDNFQHNCPIKARFLSSNSGDVRSSFPPSNAKYCSNFSKTGNSTNDCNNFGASSVDSQYYRRKCITGNSV